MTTQNMPFRDGPYLAAAFICEKLLIEPDGVPSAIRIVDRIVHVLVGPNPPATMPAFFWHGVLYVNLKSGRARGPMTLKVPLENPDGTRIETINNTLIFEGEDDRGIPMKIDLQLKLEIPGLYWFHVQLNEVEITRIPLRLIYQPQVRRGSLQAQA